MRIVLAVMTVAGALLTATAARAAEAPACELHVTAAGYPNRTFKPNAFIKIQAPPPGGVVFTTPNVAGALDDIALQELIPGTAAVTVVRHAEMLDLDTRKLGAVRLYASDAPCYADLVVDNAYAILTDTVDRQRAGVVGSIIAGGSRMVASFVLQIWRDSAGKPIRYRKKVDAPLAVTTAEVAAGADAVRADLIQASAADLKQFAAFVAAKSAK